MTQNNGREATDPGARRAREDPAITKGEPRLEMQFLRRAVADDKNLEVVALQRTADNKFMRLFIDEPESPNELAPGFPKTREELFKYRGLILGSVEAAAFTGDQLQMIADFVDQRGGGLLMLGGARSFGEGGYGGTPVAAMRCRWPSIRGRPPSEATAFARLKVAPTRRDRSTRSPRLPTPKRRRWPGGRSCR